MSRTPVGRTCALLISAWAVVHGQAVMAQQYAGGNSDGRPRNRSQMRVIETQAESGHQTHYFTIVGGVERSGVFSTDKAKLPLSELVQAAGGVAGKPQTTIRVYSRELRPRLQIFSDGDSRETVNSGEVVVVVAPPTTGPRPGANEPKLVPIACVGLLERPVVLPLRDDVANLPTLIQQLMQPREILVRTQRIDPVGRTSDWQLLSGTIIAFDPRTIDPVGLRSAQELPPAVSLEEALTPKSAQRTLPVPAAELQAASPAGMRVVEAPLSSEPFSSAPVEASASPVAPALPSPPTTPTSEVAATANSVTANTPPATLQLPAPQVVLEDDGNIATDATATASEPVIGQSDSPTNIPISLSAPLIEAPVLPTVQPAEAESAPPASTELQATGPEAQLPSRATSTVQTLSHTSVTQGPLRPEPELVPEPQPTLAEEPDAGRSRYFASTPANSELEIVPSRSPVITQPTSSEAKSNASTTAEESPFPGIYGDEQPIPDSGTLSHRRTTSGLVPIAIGVGLLTLLCLGLCVVWSRYDNVEFLPKQETFSRGVATGAAIETSTPAPANAPRTMLDAVIDHSVPIVEEQVLFPSVEHLHGAAVGHKRLVVHQAHETLAGPHFANRKPAMATASHGHADERTLRTRIREALNVSADTNQRGHAAADQPRELEPAPLDTTARTAFDVVQPVSAERRPGSRTGSLDRALRSLAEEGHS
ncbi:MAG: hypothetical protein KDA58_02830 [Planctomycetaceae bacterium]|nr:hypothetical protein [Planctomycetaceae bacterium]